MHIVIIGNSAAALAAVKSFRKYDKESTITLISKEKGLAYSRVLLPYVLRGKLQYEQMTIREKKDYEENQVSYIEDEVVALSAEKSVLTLKSGEVLHYDKLLIATGSYAVAPPIEGIKQEGIYHMWTKSDVEQLLPFYEQSCKRAVVIGSGFVALQGAWAAKYKGHNVAVVEIAERIMPNVLDVKGGETVRQKIKECGIDLYTGAVTEKIEKQADDTFLVYLKGKEPLPADYVVVGTGVRPNTQFLENSGVTVERGIPVDNQMRTNVENIYAAGDVAAGPTTFGDEHLIHALWPTAVEMGNIAGANMAGKKLIYEGSLNMNVTQMFGVTVASIGIFNQEQIDRSYEFPIANGYLKVCYKEDLVVGACLVGDSESVKLFGKLRTIIRKKIKTDCAPEKLESYLDIQIFKNKGVC